MNNNIKELTQLAKSNNEMVADQEQTELVETEIKNEISKYFHAKKYGMTNENAARKAQAIQRLILATKIEFNDKWINKFKFGEIIKNNFGRILYFKFAE